jgi:hypothetical protein
MSLSNINPNVKNLFNIMMNQFSISIINTILQKNRIDADPTLLLKQFYTYYSNIPTTNNIKNNIKNNSFTTHFLNSFIRGYIPFETRGDAPFKPRGDAPFEPRGATHTPLTPRGDAPFKPRGDAPFEPLIPLEKTQTQTQTQTNIHNVNTVGLTTLSSHRGRPSKPKIVSITQQPDIKHNDNDTLHHYYNNNNNNNDIPNFYSKHYKHTLHDELFEEPFDHELDDNLPHHTTTTRTRNKRSFIYNGITLLIDNSNLLYKPHSPHTPFALFNYSLHKIITI